MTAAEGIFPAFYENTSVAILYLTKRLRYETLRNEPTCQLFFPLGLRHIESACQNKKKKET